MFWISMPSFHQRLLSHISLPNKNKYATSFWTLHQRKRTHPHPILQFFLYWFFFHKKEWTRNETFSHTANSQDKTWTPKNHLYITAKGLAQQQRKKTAMFPPSVSRKTLSNHRLRPSCWWSWPPRPPQKRLFLAPAIEATLRSRQALQPLQAKSVPTLRCDDSGGMVVGCGCGLGLGKVFWKLSFFW